MPINRSFRVDRDDFPEVMEKISRALGLSLPKDYALAIKKELNQTWYVGGPWLSVEHGHPDIQISLAVDECYGVALDITCDESLIDEIAAVVPKY